MGRRVKQEKQGKGHLESDLRGGHVDVLSERDWPAHLVHSGATRPNVGWGAGQREG